MNNSFNLNGNKVSLREYLEFRLLSIEDRLDDVFIELSSLKCASSEAKGSSKGSSISVMYFIVFINVALTTISLIKEFIK